MERSVQVWTILQLLFSRNNIFPAFPVIPTIPNLSSNCLSTESFRESRIFKEFWKCFCPGAQPFHQWRGTYKLEQFWSFGSGEILFSLLSPSSQQFPIYHQTASPPKASAKVGSSRNFESAFAPRPDPTTNGEVHTSWNNFGALVLEKYYFPSFPRHPKNPICHHTASPSKPSAKVGLSRNFESSLASKPGPTANGEIHTSWNNFGGLTLEE